MSSSHVSFKTDYSPSPLPLHRNFSSFSLREKHLTLKPLLAPETFAELSIPEIRLPELDESFVASLERSMILEMEYLELEAIPSVPQALEGLWEYGSEVPADHEGDEEVLSEFPGWGPLDEFRMAMLRLAWRET